MKVLLIPSLIMDYFDGRLAPIAMDALRACPPYGIYLLSSVLQEAGHEVAVADLIAQGTHSLHDFRSDIESCSLVGISATSLSWPTAIEIIQQVRLIREDVPIVLGAIHPTMFDRYILSKFPVEFVIRGEAEVALPTLCNVLETNSDLHTVPNLSWKLRDGTVVRNLIAPRIPSVQLGQYPLPDYSKLPADIYTGLAIESSRGCGFDCIFCSTSYRRSWRGMPTEQFVDRLEAILPHLEKTRDQSIQIVDDEFSMAPKRATDIANLLRSRGIKAQLVYDSRAADLLHNQFLDSITEFTRRFLVGCECGYDEGLKKVGKGITTEVLEVAARNLYQHGISNLADFSFILGLPWESRLEVEKTIRFATHLFASYGVSILLQWYCMIPGSQLWNEAYRQQQVTESMYDEYGFFRNLYLFRTGVKLQPREIWEIEQMINSIQGVALLCNRDQDAIKHGCPVSIAQYFPFALISQESTALSNLREVARPSEHLIVR